MTWRLLRNCALILSLVLLAGFVGYKLGTNQVSLSWKNFQPKVEVVNKEAPPDRNVDFRLFWQVWDEVNKKFVDKSKLDPQKMVYGAISGMVGSLGDPYTVFLSPEQNKEAKSDLNGVFEGIGAQLGMKEQKIVVVAPLKNSPAEYAGVKTGDWIIKVDGRETAGWTLPEAVAKIRGPKGSKVVLNVLHPKETKAVDISIIRDTIKVDSVEWKVMEATTSAQPSSKILYLRLSRFGDSTNKEWDKAVSEVSLSLSKNKDIKGLVFDLRNNPGGFLSGAVYLASEFLTEGVVVEQEYYTGAKQTYSVNRRGKLTSIPLVILVNQGSASASEILAGALQVKRRAKVVGAATFGKGSIQEASDLAGGAGLHITVAKWLLSDGTWIQSKGLTPDIKIEQDEKDPTRDLQLEKAMEALIAS